MDDVERFVVSTGRSGSTLLSKMLDLNSEVLSLSEFIGAMEHFNRFSTEPMTGPEFSVLLGGGNEIGALIPPDRPIKDVFHEFMPSPDDLKRWGHRSPSPLFAMALPSLSPDPIALMDDLVEFANAQPARMVADQYRALWRWMGERAGKKCWVERTGANLRWLPEQRDAFPDARYVLLHRDGPETALSLRDHSWGIIAAEVFEDPPTTDQVKQALRSRADGTPHPYSHLYDDARPSVERFGRFWSFLIANGFRGFRHMRPEQLLDVRFEDLTQDPAAQLTRIKEFLELPDDDGWIERAAALITPGRLALRAPELSENEQASLEKACQIGQILLERADPFEGREAYVRVREATEEFSAGSW
ncbi:MAG: sulfotransferase [Mycetocola sp.]